MATERPARSPQGRSREACRRNHPNDDSVNAAMHLAKDFWTGRVLVRSRIGGISELIDNSAPRVRAVMVFAILFGVLIF